MACIDQDFYRVDYGGVEMPPLKFCALEKRAINHVNSITFNRIDFENLDELDESVEESVKLAICAVIDVLYKYSNPIITQEKTGDNSVTYKISTISKEKDIYKEVKIYLADTGLLYRGM